MENSLSVALSSRLVFFSVGLDKAVRIRDKIQVVYKEMAWEGAKFNVAKCNLIGSIQFRFSQI